MSFAYKIVARYSDGDTESLHSINQSCLSLFDLVYPPEVWVKPKMGQIFIFLKLEDAQAYMSRDGMNDYHELWECEYEGTAEEAGMIPYAGHDLTAFWSGEFTHSIGLFQAPQGTYMVSKVRLLRPLSHSKMILYI